MQYFLLINELIDFSRSKKARKGVTTKLSFFAHLPIEGTKLERLLSVFYANDRYWPAARIRHVAIKQSLAGTANCRTAACRGKAAI